MWLNRVGRGDGYTRTNRAISIFIGPILLVTRKSILIIPGENGWIAILRLSEPEKPFKRNGSLSNFLPPLRDALHRDLDLAGRKVIPPERRFSGLAGTHYALAADGPDREYHPFFGKKHLPLAFEESSISGAKSDLGCRQRGIDICGIESGYLPLESFGQDGTYRPVALLKKDDQILGMATLAPCSEDGQGEAQIIGIWVHRNQREQGYGIALIEALVEEARVRYEQVPCIEPVTVAGVKLCSSAQRKGVHLKLLPSFPLPLDL
jgi:GNAT superfamily N-acetyltransferase